MVSIDRKGGENMYKAFCKRMAVIAVICCLCVSAGATEVEAIAVSYDDTVVEMETISRASGSFNVSVNPYERAKGDTDFPLEAGETVRIYATYSPDDASLDFGLVDPDGVFHYVSAENGSFDETFEVPESGNYRLGIKNNSGQTVKVSGFVKY